MGYNRFDARRVMYGPTWKQATQLGRGVQRAITKREKQARDEFKHQNRDARGEVTETSDSDRVLSGGEVQEG